MAVVNELVTKFSFQGSLKPLKNFQEGLQNSILTLGKYGAAIGAVAGATLAWANSTLKGAESLVRLSQDTDLSIQKLQELEFIAAQNGVTTEEFTNNISSLSSKIGEAATSGSDDFNRLGVSVRDANGQVRSTEAVLGDLQASFANLDSRQRISFAEKLGVDARFISAVGKSQDELNGLVKTANSFGLLTEQQTKQLDKYFASVETLKFGFTAVSRQVALNFAPVLNDLAKNITGFLAEFGNTFGIVFAEFFDGIGNLLGAIDTLIDSTIGWKSVIIGLGAALLIAFPVAQIVAGIGLVLVAVEDIITAFDGGKSVIADFFKNTFDIDIVQELTSAFEFLSKWIDNLIKGFTELVNIGSNFAGGVLDTISGFFGGGSNLQPLPANADNRTSNQTQQNNVSIEIKTNDPKAAGDAVQSALSKELENASFQFGKGSGR